MNITPCILTLLHLFEYFFNFTGSGLQASPNDRVDVIALSLVRLPPKTKLYFYTVDSILGEGRLNGRGRAVHKRIPVQKSPAFTG